MPRNGNLRPLTILIVPALLLGTWAGLVRGDEPGLLGRLFRLGGEPAATGPGTAAPPLAAPSVPATFSPPGATPSPRIIPRPRVSRAVTEADPIVTRVALGRGSDGTQFAMFLQVFADGTVIDTAGAHFLGRDAITPLLDALEAGDLYRLRGHCGAPAPDFVEQVHLVVYERSLGRLRATSFSYSGNPQGCDPALARLHGMLEALQARLNPPAPPVSEVVPPPGNRGPAIPLTTPR